MKDISRCTIFPKYKHGDQTKPESFRYLVNHHNTIKILDRLWCVDVINNIKDNMPNPDIFKASLINRVNNTTSEIAVLNTNSIDSIVILDIEKAFDSLEWDVLENLLISNLTRKSNSRIATQLVEYYMIILKNRELYWNNKIVSVSKGIPTGLPSSSLVFTLALDEIIHRWFIQTKYENKKDFIMNIYVDDIYLKINSNEANEIITSLIRCLGNYQLNVNKNKSKASNNLLVDIPTKLKPTDYYLGIPFTRDIKLYGELILNEFNINKLNCNWEGIYDELCKDNSDPEVLENKRIIIGFMSYKLKPFLDSSSDKLIKDQIINFIYINWVKEIKQTRRKILMCIGMFVIMLIAIIINIIL
jgi:hypothetical protein